MVQPGFQVADIKIDPDNWLIAVTDQVVNVSIIENNDEVKVYPNPFKGHITVAVPGEKPVQGILLYSEDGKKIERHNGARLSFNWSHLPQGVYFLRIHAANKVYEKKIVKH